MAATSEAQEAHVDLHMQHGTKHFFHNGRVPEAVLELFQQSSVAVVTPEQIHHVRRRERSDAYQSFVRLYFS